MEIGKDLISGLPLCHLAHSLSLFIPRWVIKSEMKDVELEHKTKRGFIIPTGSSVEWLSVPFNQHRKPEKPLVLLSDVDFMLVLNTCPVGSESNKDTHLVIDTSCTYPGYLRLEHIPRIAQDNGKPDDKGCPVRLTHCKSVVHGDSLRSYLSFGNFRIEFAKDVMGVLTTQENTNFRTTLEGPAAKQEYVFDKQTLISVDNACALKVCDWPAEAFEFITRKRQSGWIWPPISIMQQILCGGCHVVYVPHKKSAWKDVEWRFSFTVAERILARAITPRQRQAYIVFKTLVKHSISPHNALSSYCLKNILFWCLEELPPYVWEDSFTGLGVAFFHLLDKLIGCVVQRNLPHYFIPRNNLLDDKPRDQLNSICRKLVILRKAPLFRMIEFDALYSFDHSLPTRLVFILADIFMDINREHTLFNVVKLHLQSQVKMLSEYACNMKTSGFSGTLNEIITYYPSYRNVLDFCDRQVTQWTDLTETDRGVYLCGFAWCGFIHYAADKNDINGTFRKVNHLFERGLALLSDKADLFLVCSTFYSIVLMHMKLTSAACETLENCLLKARKLPENIQFRDVIDLSGDTLSVLDENIRWEITHIGGNKYLVLPLVFYQLIQIHINTDQMSKATGIAIEFEMTLEKIRNATCTNYRTVMQSVCLYGLLGHSLETLNMLDKAKSAFRNQESVLEVHSTGGIASKVQKDIERIDEKLSHKSSFDN